MRGGRGAGLVAPPAPTTKRRVRGPLHHAARGPPPPLARGRMQCVPVPASTCARECCQTAMSNGPYPVARMERSVIRVRSTSFNAAPGFHFVPSGLRNYKPNKRKEAERRQTRYSTACTQAAHRARHGRCGLRRPFRYRARSPAGVPPTALAAATERHRSAPVHALPGTELGRDGRYPSPALPVQRAM